MSLNSFLIEVPQLVNLDKYYYIFGSNQNDFTYTNILSNFYWEPVIYGNNINIIQPLVNSGNIGSRIFTYSTDRNTIAIIDNNQIILLSSGTVRIFATLPNDPNDLSNPGDTLIFELIITRANRELIGYSITTPQTYSSTKFTPDAPTFSVGTGSITYSSNNTNVATINSTTGEITMLKAGGPVTFTASSQQTDQYTETSTTTQLTITRANRTLNGYSITTPQTYGQTPIQPTAPTLSVGTGSIIYSSSDSTIASIDASTGQITMNKAGTVTFTATVPQSDQYAQASTTFTLSILNPIYTGGDPIIQPLFGCKFALAPHIKYVNLLADYTNGIFINGHVEMLKPEDFPTKIYWDSGFSKTSDLTHMYTNSYYRKFHITFGNESIHVNADTLEVTKLTPLNKLRVVNFKPKTGIKSISFDKIYPLSNSTKGIKIGFGNYLLTIVSDINTDDRHHLELLNVKSFDVENLSGALISQNQIIKISSLEGPELYQFDSNPFGESIKKSQ